MPAKQQIRSRFLNFLNHYFNPLTLRIARSSFGPFAVVRHVGRRSGKQYETPIIVQPVQNGFVFELTYGPEVDWFKNIMAAPSFVLSWHGKDYTIERVETLDKEAGLAVFPLPERLILQATRRQHFLKMLVRGST